MNYCNNKTTWFKVLSQVYWNYYFLRRSIADVVNTFFCVSSLVWKKEWKENNFEDDFFHLVFYLTYVILFCLNSTQRFVFDWKLKITKDLKIVLMEGKFCPWHFLRKSVANVLRMFWPHANTRIARGMNDGFCLTIGWIYVFWSMIGWFYCHPRRWLAKFLRRREICKRRIDWKSALRQ